MLRDHAVFKEPFPIQTKELLIQRKTPPAFKSKVSDPTVLMLPLVRQHDRQWKNGWCTYTDGFENNPDIEIFCGGENEKAANAAALWRQGNLFHFGFEQSPMEMNETGQMILLNAIAYIADFEEDRPIAVTPSVFAGPVGYPRTYLDRRLGKEGDTSDASWILSKKHMNELASFTSDQIKTWFKDNRSFLHPGIDFKLEIDNDAKEWQIPIDTLTFFEAILPKLEQTDIAEKAKRLLKRYGPNQTDQILTVSGWRQWFEENKAYLFFSDQGDYRWYIDPLAKKRKISTAVLRGSKRASK